MTAKGSKQWIQQAVSVQLTRVAIPWLGSWAHHMLLYSMREAMTQFSVGVLPHWRHGIVIIHSGEQPVVQKEIMSDRKGESFNIAFHPEGQRQTESEKNQNKWAILTWLHPSTASHRLIMSCHPLPCEEAVGKWYFTLFPWFSIYEAFYIHLIS